MSALVKMSTGEEIEIKSDTQTVALVHKIASHQTYIEVQLEGGDWVYLNPAQVVSIREAPS